MSTEVHVVLLGVFDEETHEKILAPLATWFFTNPDLADLFYEKMKQQCAEHFGEEASLEKVKKFLENFGEGELTGSLRFVCMSYDSAEEAIEDLRLG